MSLLLLFHNIGFGFDAILALAIGIFVYAKDRKSPANITLILAMISVTVFSVSHLIGVNISDPYLSRNVLLANVSVMFISCFLAHCTFIVLGVDRKQRPFLVVSYVSAVMLTILYLAFPNSFLLPSIPKLYFPSYYVAGSLHWIMRVLFSVILPAYFIGYLLYMYSKTKDALTRNRLKYFFFSLVLGFGAGSLAIPLIYDIPIDPIWAVAFVPLWAIPFSYAVLKYNLMDVRVIAKRAIVLGSVVAATSFAIFAVGYANYAVTTVLPGFPPWLLPLFAGCVATAIGVFVWSKLKESDLLKYEFVTIMTHKLRTPLTSIKWSIEEMAKTVPDAGQTDLQHIREGVDKLVELSNILADVSSEDRVQYVYSYKDVDMAQECRAVVSEFTGRANDKHITLDSSGVSSVPLVIRADESKLKILIQTFIDNAIIYTPEGGHVTVGLAEQGKEAVLSVSDTGIGFSKEESHLIFSRLFRTDAARKAATEGMGVGLYIAKGIVERHGGRIWMQSEGQGKGSTFFVALPLRRG